MAFFCIQNENPSSAHRPSALNCVGPLVSGRTLKKPWKNRMKSGVVCIFHFGGHRKKINIEKWDLSTFSDKLFEVSFQTIVDFQADPIFPKYFFCVSKF